MRLDALLDNLRKEVPSVINNPFIKEGVKTIRIHYDNTNWFNNGPYWQAFVSFENGNTSGEQKTRRCTSFQEVVEELQAIGASL